MCTTVDVAADAEDDDNDEDDDHDEGGVECVGGRTWEQKDADLREKAVDLTFDDKDDDKDAVSSTVKAEKQQQEEDPNRMSVLELWDL